MEPQELYTQYQELQRYIGWTAGDADRLRAVSGLIQPHLPALIDGFREKISRHPNARQPLRGGKTQIALLSETLLAWLDELLAGRYDQAYVARRWRVGCQHAELGLNRVFTHAVLSRLRDRLAQLIAEHWTGSPGEQAETIRSLNKLLDLELAIIQGAYQRQHAKHQQPIERLAAIGQISAGVAHELRNPLNVVKTSVYYLLHAEDPPPEKTNEHLHRIARQLEAIDAITTALTHFAKLPLPHLQPFSLEPSLREVLETTLLPEDIQVGIQCPDDLPDVLGDQRQLMIVFGNLIRNARDAMNGGGKLSVTASRAGSSVQVAVADTGVGIRGEDLKRIDEPLYSTKTRGMGLGLAISRAILDKHAAQLEVTSQPGVGSTFTVRIAAAAAADAEPEEKR